MAAWQVVSGVNMDFVPSYIPLNHSEKLDEIISIAGKKMEKCFLCPHQ